MPSQFFKRKAKATAAEVKATLEANPGMGMQAAKDAVESTPEVLITAEHDHPLIIKDEPLIVVAKAIPDMPNTGIDVFYDSATRRHKAVVFKYNPDTNLVAIDQILPVGRQIALIHDGQKEALKTLIRLK